MPMITELICVFETCIRAMALRDRTTSLARILQTSLSPFFAASLRLFLIFSSSRWISTRNIIENQLALNRCKSKRCHVKSQLRTSNTYDYAYITRSMQNITILRICRSSWYVSFRSFEIHSRTYRKIEKKIIQLTKLQISLVSKLFLSF